MHVALFTPYVGYCALIGDNYSVLVMMIHKMHMEVGAVGDSPWESLNRSVNHGCCPWKGHAALFRHILEQRLLCFVTA